MRTASSSRWGRTSSCTTASSWRSAAIMEIVEGLARLRKAGREIVLVSSGAVGMGMRVLGLKERPALARAAPGLRGRRAGAPHGLYTEAFAQLRRHRRAGAAHAGGPRRSRSRAVPAHDADAPAGAGRDPGAQRERQRQRRASWSSTGASSRARRRRRRPPGSATTTACRRASRSASTPICWCC